MEARDIESYLAELGAELKSRGVKKPIHLMIIGGAYMLLVEHMLRTTDDIDIFWLEGEEFQQMRSIISECMLTVARKNELRHDWINFLSQILMQNDVFVPDGKLWKKFGPLAVYKPPREYILALKILAGRDKDLVDCAILLPQTKIKTRQQAQHMLSPETILLMVQTYEELRAKNVEASRTLETMKWAYQQTCAGEDPWTGLGCFSHAWYGYARDNRAALVREPLEKPEQETEHTRRWAAFSAASVEFLCKLYNVPCPEWIYDPTYTLPEPWWRTPREADPDMQEYLRKTTPPPFTRRNIFCGNRIYQNKYEMAEWTREAIIKGITDPNEISTYIHDIEKSVHGG